MKKLTEIKNNQQGLVAITVTIFFIIVLSLIVLAFSQVARREQRQTIDRQLASQAYYAAESGINDAVEWIRMHPSQSITTCSGTGSWLDLNPGTNQNLEMGSNPAFSYSCLLINQEPTSLEYGDVGIEDGETVSLGTVSGQQLKSLTFTWKEKTANGAPGGNFSGCKSEADRLKFEPVGAYSADCDAGMLRIYLMPINAGANRQSLVNGSFGAFLRPVNPAPASNTTNYDYYFNSDSQGKVVPANCSAGSCSVTIDNLVNTKYYLHMRSMYKNNQVTVTGTDLVGDPIKFNDGQAIIDSTGRASDVLRRLQVRVPIHPTFERSPYTLNSMNGICKRLGVYPQPPEGYPPGYNPNGECGGIN